MIDVQRLNYCELIYNIYLCNDEIMYKSIDISLFNEEIRKQKIKLKKQTRDLENKIKEQTTTLENKIKDLQLKKDKAFNILEIQRRNLKELESDFESRKRALEEFNILDTIEKYHMSRDLDPKCLYDIHRDSSEYLKTTQNLNLLQNLFIHIQQESYLHTYSMEYIAFVNIIDILNYLYKAWYTGDNFIRSSVLTEILELLYILKTTIKVRFEENIEKTKIEETFDTMINNHIDIMKSSDYIYEEVKADIIPEVDEIVSSIKPNYSNYKK